MTTLPNGWTEVALGEVCEIVMGQAPKGSTYNDGGDGWPLIAGAGDFSQGLPRAKKYTTAPTRLSVPGDIVLGIRASIGAKVLADDEYCLGRGVAALRATDKLDKRFLWHWLTVSSAALAAKGRGATFLQVNRRDIAEMPLPLPPLEEQRRIAAILDKADELRAKRRSALDKLESLTQSIFLDMFGDPVGNSRAWPRSALGEVAATASGGTPDRAEPRYFGGAIRWVKSGELHSGVVVDTEETLTPEGLANSAAKLLPPGTLLVAMYGATAGVVATLGVSAATNQAVCSITPGPRIDGTFLTQVLRLMSRKLLARRHGGAQPNLSQKVIRHLEIPVPPLDMQTQFAQTFDRVKRCAAMSSDSAERADALLASLQSRAFRGEL